jgi:hypothetical protein
VIYKQEDIQLVREEYRDIELDQAIQEDRLIDYVLDEAFSNQLTIEQHFLCKQEILKEDENLDKNGIAGIAGISVEELEKLDSVEPITNMIDRLNEKEREEEDKLAKAEADKKGIISKVIYYIKKVIRWLKRKLLRIKDRVSDFVHKKPTGFSAAVRGAKENMERGAKSGNLGSFADKIFG